MIPDLITHLGTATTSFETIAHAWMMQPVEDLSEAVPALYLWPGNRSATPEIGTTCPRQEIIKRVNIFIVCPPLSHDDLWVELWDAMVGYQVDQHYEGMAFAEGDTVKIIGNYLWWRDVYQTKRLHRKDA